MAPAPLTVRRITADEHLDYVRERSDQSSISFLPVPSWAGAKAEWSHASLGWFDADERLVGAGLVLLRQVPRVKRYLAYLPEGPDIDWTGDSILLKANAESRVLAVLDVFQTKLIKRGVSLKAVETGDPRLSGKEYRIEATLKDGLSQENAKKVGKIIREQGPKGVKTQITGDEMRVTSKSRDDLQEIIALLNAADLDFAVQFVNYR